MMNHAQHCSSGTHKPFWFAMGHAHESTVELALDKAITDIKPQLAHLSETENISAEIYLIAGKGLPISVLSNIFQLLQEKCDCISENSHFVFATQTSSSLADSVKIVLLIKAGEME